MRQLTFEVKATTSPGETVCVSGNCSELGNWKADKCVELVKISDSDGDLWGGTVKVPYGVQIEFRYVVCVILAPNEHRSTVRKIVRRWETDIQPRNIPPDDTPWKAETTQVFGLINDSIITEHGWLTAESIVQFKLFGGNPIKIWKRKHAGSKSFYVKITPVDLQINPADCHEDVESPDGTNEIPAQIRKWPIVEVCAMNEDDCEFREQDQFGKLFQPGENVIFQTQMLDISTVAYMIDIFVNLSADITDPPEHIGFCYVLPSVLKDSVGTCVVPITGAKHDPIGQLTVEYMLVHPIQDHECDLSVSYARYWRKGRSSLDVGHRGAGNSFCQRHCSDVRENTLASLILAAKHGADYVEFDVQLTKDKVPVLYHDFHVCITMKKKTSLQDEDYLVLPLKDLTFDQLQMLKINSVKEKENRMQKFAVYRDDEATASQPFPTLQKALSLVPPHVGFNVEIKWNMQRKDGTVELENPMEMNMYLDIILRTIMESAGNRRVIISCFHPDVCTMIRYKQNKYPVLFLTQGKSERWPEYIDPRTNSIPMAVYYARSAGILGIDVHTEEIMKDTSMVRMCKAANLVMFCWGDDNNEPEVLEQLKQLGLDAIIYDRIFDKKAEADNVFLVEEKARAKLPSPTENGTIASQLANGANEKTNGVANGY